MKTLRSPFALATSGLLSFFALTAASQATLIVGDTVDSDLTVTEDFFTGTDHAAGGTEIRLGGLVIAKGTFNSSPALVTGDEGAGTRMLWYPRKAAFRAGRITGTHWNNGNIGEYSVAFGVDNTASGYAGSAFGYDSTASGTGAFAAGYYGRATGGESTALGYGALASGSSAFAAGFYVTASGERSTAFGIGSASSGNYATAFGASTVASGESTTSMGMGTKAHAFTSTAIGRYNVGTGSPTTWVAGDSLFEVGNGTSNTARSNAFTVYKNGDGKFQGVIICAPGGDIPSFGE
jgi:hypothetical protein